MKLSGNGRFVLACAVTASALGLSSCGSYTTGYLWVLEGKATTNGAGNTITGYKIDDYSGNLTEMVGSPFTAGGSNPVMGVVKSGGRYVYVLNQNDPTNSVVQFSVGGDGVLTEQQAFASQGGTPQWMDISSDGSFLYVLDSVSPARNSAGTAPACTSATGLSTAACGSITVFAIDATTGRLTLVQNQSVKVNGTYLTYTSTGPAPTRVKTTSAGAILVVNADQTVTSLTVGSNGQLTVSANSTQIIDQSKTIGISSITVGGSYLYLTDSVNNRILQYTVSSSGVLQPVTGGQVTNFVSNVTPVWTLTDSANRFVYVLNQNNTSTTTQKSSIGAYTIQTNGNLTTQSDALNPYAVGSGPVCMVEDPSKQWVYTSNQDGTVTGYHIDHSTGRLTVLQHGSSFTAAGRPSFLIVSGITS
jgi:6-phosphogluconolactonase